MQTDNSGGVKEGKPQDKRTARTLRCLVDAMAEISKEKPVYRITVAELAARADISRGTFYLHFSDIYDMYEKVEGYVLERIGAYFDEHQDSFTKDTYEDFVKKTVRYIEEEKDLFKMLFSMQSFKEAIASYLNRFYLVVWEKYLGKDITCENWSFLMDYHTYGMLAAFGRWLNAENDFKEEKLKELILIFDEAFDDMVKRNCM